MKSFYITLCLFIIMLAFISVNQAYVRSFSETLIRACEQMDGTLSHEEVVQKAEWILNEWSDNKHFLQITVAHSEIESIDNAVDELWIYASQGDPVEFEKARQISLNAFEALGLAERLTFNNIL